MQNLHYVANIRLPTTRAHGTQIVKMCEAFAETNLIEVSLIYPGKKIAKKNSDIFSYYNVKKNFEVVKISSTDFLGKTLRFGKLFFIIDNLSFFLKLFFVSKIKSGDIIYSRNPLFLLPFLRNRYTLCTEIHDIPQRKFYFYLLVKRAHHIIALNNFVKNDLVKLGIQSEKIFVAYDAVDIKEFGDKLTKEEARDKIGLNIKNNIALYSGHFYGWKGADIFAKAARITPEFSFVCVGGVDPDLTVFKKEFSSIKNLTILPFQDRSKIPMFIKSADVCVIPNSAKTLISNHYTSPLKLFEYMAAQKPIVASDLPSIREVLNEENAVLIKPDSPEALSDGIKMVLNNNKLAENIAINAYKDINQYTWGERAKSIVSHLHSSYLTQPSS